MSRAKNRKITIKLVGRNPNDNLSLFKNIEEVFRPKEVEIEVRSQDSSKENISDDAVIKNVADEQLEQEITEEAKKLLDKHEESVKAKPKKKQKDTTRPSYSRLPSSKNVSSKRKKIAQWLKNVIVAGYHITVKAITEAMIGK